MLRLLAFSDLHGGVTALKGILRDAYDVGFDYILISGDITDLDASFDEGESALKRTEEIFNTLEQYDVPYYFVWGNWDLTISFLRGIRYRKDEGWRMDRNLNEVRFFNDNGRVEYRVPRPLYEYSLKVIELLESLRYARPLDIIDSAELGEFKLTSNHKLVDGRTIFLTHVYGKRTEAYLHLEGHNHFGRVCGNYINLGFAYRWRSQEEGEVGCYWLIDLPDKCSEPPKITWINYGGNMREVRCSKHLHQGVFYIPYYWNGCPVCYKKK
jgi:predicted phosphodiesterase